MTQIIMEKINKQDIANYFDIPPKLLPFIPELFKDLWELGSSPKVVLEWISHLKLPAYKTKVLDLGCGKGAVSITLARELKFNILGH